MPHIVFTSDVQLFNHVEWSKVLPSGRNSRFQNGLDCLEQAFRLAHGGTLVINGDLFHDRKHIAIDVLHGTMELFLKYTKVPTIISVGNHDQYLRDGSVHSTSIFSGMPNVTVVTAPTVMTVDGCHLFIHPFTEDTTAFKDQVIEWAALFSESKTVGKTIAGKGVLVAHQGVSGALLAGNVKAKGEIVPSDLQPEHFDHVILGHYHRPQTIGKNIHYIGSPYEVDAGEAGDEKRFLMFDDRGLSSIPVTGMPKYLRVTAADAADALGRNQQYAHLDEQDFITVVCSTEGELNALKGSGAKLLLQPSDTHVKDISIGSIRIEDAVKKDLEHHKRPDLFGLAKSRLGI